jgi:hypothetical protein
MPLELSVHDDRHTWLIASVEQVWHEYGRVELVLDAYRDRIRRILGAEIALANIRVIEGRGAVRNRVAGGAVVTTVSRVASAALARLGGALARAQRSGRAGEQSDREPDAGGGGSMHAKAYPRRTRAASEVNRTVVDLTVLGSSRRL